jgi:chemotaxis protein methyltransferase CheR
MEVFAQKLSPRLKSLRLKTFREYYDYLLFHPFSQKEVETIMSIIINTESYFMREKSQFAVFMDLLNKTKRKKIQANDQSIRILSAGCSAGQEPYSIAITVRDSGTPLRGWKIKLLGMDINPALIEKAKRGVFNSYSLRGVEEKIIAHYFKHLNRDYYRISSEISKKVSFIRGNLMKPAAFRKLRDMDFIFCRNVLLYMSKQAVDRIILNLWESLSDNGYLFVGQSESSIKQELLFKPVHLNGVTVYQKISPRRLNSENIQQN